MRPFTQKMTSHCITYGIFLLLLTMTGCSAPLPNIHNENLLEYYRNTEGLDVNKIDDKWQQFSGMPMEITEDQFGEMVVRSSLPVVVEFYAYWCGYCANFTPIFREMAREYEGRVRFATMNYDRNKNLLHKLNLAETVPIFLLIKNGTVLDRWYGIKGGKNGFKKRLKEKLNLE